MSDLFDQAEGAAPAENEAAGNETGSEGDVPFETALEQLEEAVERLEAGDLSLTEALGLFEEGLKASNLCRARLEEAKQKVEALVARNDGSFRLSEVDMGGDEDDEDE